MTLNSRTRLSVLAAGTVAALIACAAPPPRSPAELAAEAKQKHDAALIKKMQSYVGWNIGSFMSDWSLTPTQTSRVPDGNIYEFIKEQADSKCMWTVKANEMGNIVQWSMRGNACPNADGP